MGIEDIKLREISIFLELLKVQSVRELSRNHNIPPGQVSKIIKGLEKKVGISLLDRSISGVRANARAHELMVIFEGLQKFQHQLEGETTDQESLQTLTVACASFFSTHFLPKVFSKTQAEFPAVRLRLVDLAPNQFVSVGLRNGFQICVHMGNLDWPRTWTSVQVGQIRWILCCRAKHPILKNKTLREILKHPFVVPVYWSSEGLRYGNDNCPVPLRQRKAGYETATAASAAEIVKSTDQLAFLPEIVLQPYLERREIDVIEVPSWKAVTEPVFLTVKSDHVSQRFFNAFLEACKTKMQL